MKKTFTHFHYGLSKQAAKISARFVWILFAIIATFIIIIPWIGVWIKPLSGISKFWVDILSPVSVRNIPYKPDEASWFSSIAYSIGVVLISGVLIAIITNYLRTIGDRYKTGTLDRYHWSNHTLFLGYDELMIGTLRKVCNKGHRVVVTVPEAVESVRSKITSFLNEEQERYVEVIQCRYTDKNELDKKACVKNASQIFIIGQPDDPTHDASNLKSLDIIAEHLGEETDIAAYINIRNRASLSLIQRQGFERENDRKLRRIVNPFNFYENMAANLLTGFDKGKELMTLDFQNNNKNLAKKPRDTRVHLVILGMTEMGMALAREALMVAHYPERRIKITLVDGNAREEMFFFRGRYKELFNECKSTFIDLDRNRQITEKFDTPDNGLLDIEFEFIQCSIAHPKLMRKIEDWAKEERDILTLAICSNDSPKNMATALYLPRIYMDGENSIPVWVYQQGDDSLKEFCGHNFYKSIHTFSPSEYGDIELIEGLGVLWAEEVAMAYKKSSNRKDAATEWNQMTQYERWSTLYNVRSMYIKLRGMGYELKMEDKKVSLFSFTEKERTKLSHLNLTEEEINKLAETEHIRWMADTLTKGFRKTSKKEHEDILTNKDKKKEFKEKLFAHDNLCSFNELEEEKNYDIDMTNVMIQVINRQIKKMQ